MKIKIIRNCAIGGQHREAGTVVDVDKVTAIALVTLHRAVLVESEKVESRDPVVEQRDPEIVTTTRKAKRNG